MSRATQGTPRRSSVFAYGSLTLFGAVFQPLLLTSSLPYRGPTTPMDKSTGLASSRFARHYSGNRILFLFLRILRCFTSPRVASFDYVFIEGYPGIHQDGLPHSETHGSKRACRSPWLIATYCVLHRRLVPRHSPAALSSLIKPIRPACAGQNFGSPCLMSIPSACCSYPQQTMSKNNRSIPDGPEIHHEGGLHASWWRQGDSNP